MPKSNFLPQLLFQINATFVKNATLLALVITLEATDVKFKVEYLWNGRVKKDGVDAKLVYYNSPKFK